MSEVANSVVVLASEAEPQAEYLVEEPERQWGRNSEAFIRMMLAAVDLQDAILDFLEAENDLEEDEEQFVTDADHALYSVTGFLTSLESEHLGVDGDPYTPRTLRLWKKLAQRLDQNPDRTRWQTESGFYHRARREVEHETFLLEIREERDRKPAA
jgi:hypothetical protein